MKHLTMNLNIHLHTHIVLPLPGAGPDVNHRLDRLESQMAEQKAGHAELRQVLQGVKQDFLAMKDSVANILADEQRQDAKILELEQRLTDQAGGTLPDDIAELLGEVKTMSSNNTQSVADLAARIPDPQIPAETASTGS